MRFVARYIIRGEESEHYRTIYADDINEANKLAMRYTPKGYMLLSVIEKQRV